MRNTLADDHLTHSLIFGTSCVGVMTLEADRTLGLHVEQIHRLVKNSDFLGVFVVATVVSSHDDDNDLSKQQTTRQQLETTMTMSQMHSMRVMFFEEDSGRYCTKREKSRIKTEVQQSQEERIRRSR